MGLINRIDNLNFDDFEKNKESFFLKFVNNKDLLSKLINKAYLFKEYEFISGKLNDYFLNKNDILREDNEILAILIHSNIFLNKHTENYNIYSKCIKKIQWNSEHKRLILNRIEYSMYELEKYDIALTILNEIKKYSDKDFKNYIECLIKIKNYDKALSNLKKYIPKTDEKKIWKAITYAELIFYSKKNNDLKKYLKIAENTFLKYRITDEEIPNSQYYYIIGMLYNEIGDNVKSINYFRLSKNNVSELIIDIKYNSMAIEKLKEMEA